MIRYAGIDIGSNTILMAILDWHESGRIEQVDDFHEIARLGEKVDETGFLQQEAIARASVILKKYSGICADSNVGCIVASATSAMRDAANGPGTAEIFSKILGTKINIIGGKDEAAISYLGSIDCGIFPDFGKSAGTEKSLVIDIGGGSTELITGRGMEFENAASINIGSVRLTEKFFAKHPPAGSEIDNAIGFIKSEFLKSGFEAGRIDRVTAVAGTATTLASISANIREFDSAAINGLVLGRDSISGIFELLLSISTTEMTGKYGVHPKRADVITAGALILKTLSDIIGFETCRVSVQGLRYGLVFNEIKKIINH